MRARGPHAAHFRYFGGSRIVAEQTANVVQKLHLINRNIQLSKFVNLLSDYWAKHFIIYNFVTTTWLCLETRKREVTVGDVKFNWSMYFVVF